MLRVLRWQDENMLQIALNKVEVLTTIKFQFIFSITKQCKEPAKTLLLSLAWLNY